MTPRGDSLASDWGHDLRVAASGLKRARAALERANDARAVAVWRARRAGITSRQLGELLGMAHKNILVLERRGAQVAERPTAAEAVPCLVVDHTPEPVRVVVAEAVSDGRKSMPTGTVSLPRRGRTALLRPASVELTVP